MAHSIKASAECQLSTPGRRRELHITPIKERMVAIVGTVLVVHDTTELGYSNQKTLASRIAAATDNTAV